MTLYDVILMGMIALLVALGWGVYLQLDKIIDILTDGVAYPPHQGRKE